MGNPFENFDNSCFCAMATFRSVLIPNQLKLSDTGLTVTGVSHGHTDTLT